MEVHGGKRGRERGNERGGKTGGRRNIEKGRWILNGNGDKDGWRRETRRKREKKGETRVKGRRNAYKETN